MGNQLTVTQNGNLYTRGDYGEPVTQLHRIVWDPELNDWRKATEDDSLDHTAWGAWDSAFGWMAPWEPIDPPLDK